MYHQISQAYNSKSKQKHQKRSSCPKILLTMSLFMHFQLHIQYSTISKIVNKTFIFPFFFFFSPLFFLHFLFFFLSNTIQFYLISPNISVLPTYTRDVFKMPLIWETHVIMWSNNFVDYIYALKHQNIHIKTKFNHFYIKLSPHKHQISQREKLSYLGPQVQVNSILRKQVYNSKTQVVNK